jgi:hypothetical protein
MASEQSGLPRPRRVQRRRFVLPPQPQERPFVLPPPQARPFVLPPPPPPPSQSDILPQTEQTFSDNENNRSRSSDSDSDSENNISRSSGSDNENNRSRGSYSDNENNRSRGSYSDNENNNYLYNQESTYIFSKITKDISKEEKEINLKHPIKEQKLNTLTDENIKKGYLLCFEMLDTNNENYKLNFDVEIFVDWDERIVFDKKNLEGLYVQLLSYANNEKLKYQTYIPIIEEIGGKAINGGGVRRNSAILLGKYITEKYMFYIINQPNKKCNITANSTNKNPLVGGYKRTIKNKLQKYKKTKQIGGAATAAAAETTTKALNSSNNKSTNQNIIQSQYFDANKINNTDPEELGKILGYFAFFVPRIHNDGLSLGINFSIFTLLILFNYFELRAGSKLSTVFDKIIKIENVNDYLDIKYDEYDLPISFNVVKAGERSDIFKELDKELLKYVGILLCINEIDEPDKTLEQIDYSINGHNGHNVDHPYSILMNLVIPFLYSDKTEITKLMSQNDDNHKSPYYLITDIISKLQKLELLSKSFIEYFKILYDYDYPIDYLTTDIETLGQCINENVILTPRDLLSVIKIENDTPNFYLVSYLEDIINSFTSNNILDFIKFVTGSIKLPEKIIIKIIYSLNPLTPFLVSHTCSYTLDININIKGNINHPNLKNILEFQLKNAIGDTTFTIAGGSRNLNKNRHNKKQKIKYSKKYYNNKKKNTNKK